MRSDEVLFWLALLFTTGILLSTAMHALDARVLP
jgi:hypothetical protein